MTISKRKGARASTAIKGALGGLTLLVGLIGVCGLSAGSAGAAPVANKHHHKQVKKTITIGFPDDLTGQNAFAGVEQERVAKVAVATWNKHHKNIKLKLDPIDTQSSPTAAVTGVEQLLGNSSVKAIIGIALSQSGQAIEPLLKQAKIPSIFLQASVLGKRPKNVFSMAVSSTVYEPLVMTKYVIPQRVKSIAVIYQTQPTLNADDKIVLNESRSHGIAVLKNIGTSFTATDFSSQVSAVLGVHPAAIALMALPAVTGTMVSEIRGAGYKGIIVGQQGDGAPTFLKTAGNTNADGVVYATSWSPVGADKEGRNAIAAYSAAYPNQPAMTTFGMEAWDAIYIYGQAVAKAGTDKSAAVVKQLNHDTFTGGMLPKEHFLKNGLISVKGEAIQYLAGGKQKVLFLEK